MHAQVRPLVHWGPRKIFIWLNINGVCHSLIARVMLGTPFYAILIDLRDGVACNTIVLSATLHNYLWQ